MGNILLTRQHKTLDARGDQLSINLLAYHGGAEYIDARLCRWPSESDVDFYGDAGATTTSRFLNNGNTATIGRQQRAFLTNYARRITEKINQYVFQTAPHRDGIDPEWALDVTRTGVSISQFMAEVSSLLTVCRWCWVGVDRPATEGPRSKAAVAASGDRVYWQLYAPHEVVDWSFDSRGNIAWLLLEREEYANEDPAQEAKTTLVRYLYRPGKVTKYVINEKKDGFSAQEDIAIPGNTVPFRLVGLPCEQPWWFDDVEKVQRTIMDLHSSLDTAIFKAVFPVLVVSESFRNSLTVLDVSAQEARKKIGLGNPLTESADEKNLTRWLTGTTADLEFIRTEIDRRGNDLYDIVGLAMKMPESKQVASAEAKAWDHLDTETVLAQRATVLEEAEQKLIELSQIIGGPIFTPYTVSYAKTFDLSDFLTDIQGIAQATGLNMPMEAEKMLVKAALKSAAKRFNMEPDDLQAALEAVDAQEDLPPPPPLELPGQKPDPNADPNQS
jgi:hypothetical protein